MIEKNVMMKRGTTTVTAEVDMTNKLRSSEM